MLSKEKYISLSLELHLFFDRIMKEHALFLEASFTPKNTNLSKEAVHYKDCFERLLLDTVKLSNLSVNEEVINSGEIITEYTIDAEKKTKYYTGLGINTKVTLIEKSLKSKDSGDIDFRKVKNIKNINNRAIKLLDGLINFKMKILDGVLGCKLFTLHYPLLIEHLIHEAKAYRSYLKALESNKDISKENVKDTELFWDDIMKEHSLFIRGLLDPSEKDNIKTSNKFANEFSQLIKKTEDATSMTINDVQSETIMETIKIRDFKMAAAKGILDCKIRSVILPLLADHVLREANHYLRLLNECE